MWTRVELKERAKGVLAQCRWMAVAVSLIWTALSGASSGSNSSSNSKLNSDDFNNLSEDQLLIVIGTVLAIVAVALVIGIVMSVFISGPMEIGVRKFFIKAREGEVLFKNVGFGFSNNYLKNVGVMFFRALYIFLWSLLLCIPGIIKTYEYRMIPYLLADNPDLTKEEVFSLTKKMMTGQKWDTFILDLSFLGWTLLGALTCGLLNIFHVNPYINCTQAELYAVLKENLVRNDAEAARLLRASSIDAISLDK